MRVSFCTITIQVQAILFDTISSILERTAVEAHSSYVWLCQLGARFQMRFTRLVIIRRNAISSSSGSLELPKNDRQFVEGRRQSFSAYDNQ